MPTDEERGYRAMAALMHGSHRAAQFQLPGLIRDSAAELGASDAVVYLADLQQTALVPFTRAPADAPAALPIDTTLAGRAYQQVVPLTQSGDGPGSTRLWLPLIDGTERVGVLALTVDAERAQAGTWAEAERFAALVAEVIVTKTMYGDQIVRLRRRHTMSLPGELQWSLLPPLTFACRDVEIAGALEPAYQVAGDTLDFAVDEGIARAAVFDGMGHSLRSGQLSALAVGAYRHARRAGMSLVETGRAIDEALIDGFDGASFATAVLAELDTSTGVLSFVNAGHPQPLLLREHHVIKPLDVRPRPPLGLRLSAKHQHLREFTVGTEALEPGDRVLLYTDGVTEGRSPDGEPFGDDRLVDLLRRNFASRLNAAETMRRVVRALLDHQGGRLSDDATLVLLAWQADEEEIPGSA